MDKNVVFAGPARARARARLALARPLTESETENKFDLKSSLEFDMNYIDLQTR